MTAAVVSAIAVAAVAAGYAAGRVHARMNRVIDAGVDEVDPRYRRPTCAELDVSWEDPRELHDAMRRVIADSRAEHDRQEALIAAIDRKLGDGVCEANVPTVSREPGANWAPVGLSSKVVPINEFRGRRR